MSDEIDYVYFDADKLERVDSLSELKERFFKGIKPVYENVYPHYASGQILHSMSSTREIEATLRVKLIKAQAKFVS